MQTYFIDTSIAIEYIRGKREVSQFVNSLKASLYTNYIVIAELSEGIYRVNEPKKMEKGIDNFINGMDGVISINYNIAKRFGKIRADLKKKGHIIEDFDILIASDCIENNMPILTLNKKHFERVEGLEVFTPEDFKS